MDVAGTFLHVRRLMVAALWLYFNLCNREHISSPSLISRMSEMSLGLNEKNPPTNTPIVFRSSVL